MTSTETTEPETATEPEEEQTEQGSQTETPSNGEAIDLPEDVSALSLEERLERCDAEIGAVLKRYRLVLVPGIAPPEPFGRLGNGLVIQPTMRLAQMPE